MKSVGIICEYNPFHSGHKYQIEKAKAITNADVVIAVMSGNFVQRGDIAVFDKKIRADAAIKNGVDLVIELPITSALSGAEHFAMSGVHILNAINADFISFGVENDDIQKLWEIARLLSSEPVEFKEKLAKHLGKGLSYAVSRSRVAAEFISNAEEILGSPNNILAVEYLKALIKINSETVPIPIMREGSGYNFPDLDKGFISASGARELVFGGKDLSGYVPENILSLYNTAKVHSIESMEKAIIARLCQMTAEEIAKTPDLSEGLENRIKNEAMRAENFQTLCDAVKSKRYAHSRIRRILLGAYLGIKKEDLVLPKFIKILDFNERGQKFLNEIRLKTMLPLVKNFNQIRDMNDLRAETIWKNELIFDKIYNLY